ncbi:hypothetical protein D3C87_1717170 [compost metagenome]
MDKPIIGQPHGTHDRVAAIVRAEQQLVAGRFQLPAARGHVVAPEVVQEEPFARHQIVGFEHGVHAGHAAGEFSAIFIVILDSNTVWIGLFQHILFTGKDHAQ